MNSNNKATLLILAAAASFGVFAQQTDDTLRITINPNLKPIRIAVADFNSTVPPATAKLFNDVVWNDLEASGLFTMVSKSFYPTDVPSQPPVSKPAAWGAPPVGAEMLVYGNLSMAGDRLLTNAYLDAIGNAQSPNVMGKRYTESSSDAPRVIAHRFACDIIARLGGGQGNCESRIYFVSKRGRDKEIWSMDYDGANQHAITQYKSLSLTPAVSADGSKIAFTCYARGNPDIFVLALDTNHQLTFSNQRGLNTTPAWSPDGKKLAISSSFTGDPEIYTTDANGGSMVRLTHSPGVDISPTWNPKTGAQIAFVSDRGGLPQVYLMDSDGSNVRRLTAGGGDAVDPAWAPNGELLAFSWTRGFAPGNYNIFVMDVASGKMMQLTHGAGRNEQPSWAPDGRHIVFESDRGGGTQIYTMLADGTQVRALTSAGINTSPVWSAR